MYPRVVKYTDFDGEQQEETLYFHLGRSEVADLEKDDETSFSKMLMDVGKKIDGAKIINMCKTIIARSYGVKSPDGKHFWKKPEILEDFLYSAAYDQLLWELLQSPSEALGFLANVMPFSKEEREKIQKPLAEAQAALAAAEEEAKNSGTVTPLVDGQ